MFITFTTRIAATLTSFHKEIDLLITFDNEMLPICLLHLIVLVQIHQEGNWCVQQWMFFHFGYCYALSNIASSCVKNSAILESWVYIVGPSSPSPTSSSSK